jgi:Domain of unknown function (DUF4249)
VSVSSLKTKVEKWIPLERVSIFLLTKSLLFLTTLLPFAFFSCAREEDIEVGGGSGALAVFCAIAPGDSLFVSVQYSAPINKWIAPNDLMVDDATVSIADVAGNSILLRQLSKKGSIYGASQQSFSIRAGQTYYLLVSTPNGHNASSQCTVPVTAAKWKTFENKGIVDANVGNGFSLLEGTWVGLRDQTLGYHVSIDYYKASSGIPINSNPNWTIAQLGNLYIFRESFLVSEYHSMAFMLCTLDDNLTKFNQMLAPYINTRDLQRNDLVNSFKGVYPQFTNIVGGYGFFGAYLTDRKLVIF